MNGGHSLISKTYAAAIFELSQQEDNVKSVQEELSLLVKFMDDEKDFFQLASAPYLTIELKERLIEKIFAQRLSSLTMNFLRAVIKHNRMFSLPQIAAEYDNLSDKFSGFSPVNVTVARSMTESELEKLRADIASVIGGDVKLKVDVNPSIIGGVVIKYGDKQVDNSIRRKLHQAVQSVKQKGG